MKYNIIGYQRYIGYDKVYFSVEADSPEEALAMVKENPDNYDIEDSKCVDLEDFEFIDYNNWEVR